MPTISLPLHDIRLDHPNLPKRVLAPCYSAPWKWLLSDVLHALRDSGWKTALYTYPREGSRPSREAVGGLYDEIWDDWELFSNFSRMPSGLNVETELERFSVHDKTVVVIDAFDTEIPEIKCSVNKLLKSSSVDLVLAIHRQDSPIIGLDYSLFDAVAVSPSAAWNGGWSMFGRGSRRVSERIGLLQSLPFRIPIDRKHRDYELFISA